MHTLYARQAEEENVLFEDTRETQFYSFPASSPDFTADTSAEQLGDFLKRPTLIKTISWLPAGVSDADFDPWYLYFNSTEIKKKLDNFAFFRGNMHIKVVVNASPFYYGCMLINYTPTPSFVAPIDNTNVTALIPQSQKPRIWIDLRTNMGGEMILPFIWPYNYVTLTSAAAVQDLGDLRNITYAPLSSANGATVTGVTIKIYAWLEEVELHGNTTKLALQAKREKADEYGNGPISRPATALAHWASYLVNVPIIGTYAKATQIGASAVSSVAGLFGWSKIPVIENVKPVKPLFFHDLASAHLSEPISKVTLDPKAELSVDPKIVCASNGADELAISNIVQKESFLFSTIWYSSDSPDTLLGAVNVCPMLLDAGSATSTVYRKGYTPMAYIAEMFDNWRGDIIFTIKVVASQYHRGRLRVHWDPAGNIITTDVSNRTLTKIVDIGESTEIEFRVPYLSYSMWLNLPSSNSTTIWSRTSVPTFDAAYFNGALSMRVLNNLSAPVDTANVTVMVFVRGAENLEYANPNTIDDKNQFYDVQGLVEDVDIDEQAVSTPLDDRYLINWGEAIPSLRLLLQRSCVSQSVSLHNIATAGASYYAQMIELYQCRFPTSPGYDPNSYTSAAGVVTPGTQYKYNFVHHTPLTWISPMFVARRGSIQWHFHLTNPSNIITGLRCTRFRGGLAANQEYLVGTMVTTVPSLATTRSRAIYLTNGNIQSALTGEVLTDIKCNPSISVEMPQMTMQRYQFTLPTGSLGFSGDGSDIDTYKVSTILRTVFTDLGPLVLTKYCNAGTDFSLSMFLCTPHTYYCATAGDSVT